MNHVNSRMKRAGRSTENAFLVFLVLGFMSSWVEAQEPVFVRGDLTKLKVKIIKKPKAPRKGLLVIEVKNRNRVAAEPLDFMIHVNDPEHAEGRVMVFRYSRAGLLTWGKAGRAIPPNGKLRYFFPDPWPNTPLDKVTVDITRASFFRGAGQKKSPVSIVKIEQIKVFDDYLKQKVKTTRVLLRNKIDLPVDLLLVVRTKAGKKPTIMSAHLEGNEEKFIGESNTPGADFLLHARGFQMFYGRFKVVQIVDWTVQYPAATTLGEEILETAWRQRYRWDLGEKSEVIGTVHFAFEEFGNFGRSMGVFDFRRSADGRIQFDLTRPAGKGKKGALARAIATTIEDFTSVTFDALKEKSVFVLLDRLNDGRDIVWVKSKKKNSRSLPAPIMTIKDNQIVNEKWTDANIYPNYHRTNTQLKDGRFCAATKKGIYHPGMLPETPIFDSSVVAGTFGSIFGPKDAMLRLYEFGSGKPVAQIALSFSGIKITGEKVVGAISGNGVSLLRAAWQRPYRYPSGSLNLKGTLALQVAKTNENWWGYEQLEGRIKFVGWRGAGKVFDDFHFKVKEKLSKEAKKAVDDLARARLSIWSRQDFCARPLFERAFRGCAITRGDENGLVRVKGHERIMAVRVTKGLPVEVRYNDGTYHVRRFKKVKSNWVPVETQWHFPDRTAILRTKFKQLNRAWLFPITQKYENWFHPGWGPETYNFTLKKL